ncbi:MAG: diguanylate cyclase [Lachnospiraceae bacterium]|nr:diguanylate cyclase [Lachnospiraceae bacterium]
MKTRKLKQTIVAYLSILTVIIMTMILVIVVVIQVETAQKRAYAQSLEMFYQVENILDENEAELDQITMEYSASCLANAQTIAYIIQYHPEILDDIDELKKIAHFVQVDEIHIFDKSGSIFFGTHPEYYGYNFDSGEQMNFFKPLLNDRNLRLVQEIAPNTAEGKLVQYSALWSEDGEFIVQVGMYPSHIMRMREKNELPYIFSTLVANPGVSLYAIDPESGEILGASEPESVGLNASDIGIALEVSRIEGTGVIQSVNDRSCFTSFREVNGTLLGYVVPLSDIYSGIPTTSFIILLGLAIISVILVMSFTRCIDRYVIDNINIVNDDLRRISDGNLDTTVDVHNSQEFSELSSHINEMVHSLLASVEKISHVLGRANLHIGVYDCKQSGSIVRYTEYVGKVLGLEPDPNGRLYADRKDVRNAIESLTPANIEGEDNIYVIPDNGSFIGGESFIRLEEVRTANGDFFGIITDVTESIRQRKQIEMERDEDVLTGLYNRRGLDSFLLKYSGEEDKDRFCALIMIDLDDLKVINDKYGHDAGDGYIKSAAYIISSFATGPNICARQGGDEFVVFLYRYGEEQLQADLDHLKSMQSGRRADLGNGIKVALKFSMGYSIGHWTGDYAGMLKAADELMYQNKKQRKAEENRNV